MASSSCGIETGRYRRRRRGAIGRRARWASRGQQVFQREGAGREREHRRGRRGRRTAADIASVFAAWAIPGASILHRRRAASVPRTAGRRGRVHSAAGEDKPGDHEAGDRRDGGQESAPRHAGEQALAAKRNPGTSRQSPNLPSRSRLRRVAAWQNPVNPPGLAGCAGGGMVAIFMVGIGPEGGITLRKI